MEIRGCRLSYATPFFNEFVVELPADPEEVNRTLLRKGIIGGLPLKRAFPEGPESMERQWLVAVTEMSTRAEIDRLAETVEGAL